MQLGVSVAIIIPLLVYDNKMWVLGGDSAPNKNDVWYSTNGKDWERATDGVQVGLVATHIAR